ncbi:MAG: sugar ABC transporter ATP-binding protein [Actinobacteria bacterium]|nr:sugar ABC transporter ATP-binding protein [Actinomycetota bacterium]MBU4449853.1 sugar ABC transporter ATP-binding protein [Actinomycetota bacterium]
MNEKNVFIELKNIRKIFPGVVALENVDFDVRYGEVHALVGENGAGKSTLIKILGGAYQPDGGEIFIEGEKISISSTSMAQHLKMAVIYQEFNLIPDLSVAENIFIGREPKIGKSFINWNKLNNDAAEILKKLDIDINPRKFISDLSVAEKQMVEIAKSLSMDARLIIMDEPTATLTEKEVVKLFSIIEELRKKGVSIVYISHRLDEAFRLSDRITVLRDGKRIETKKTSETNQDEIISLMVGKIVNDYFAGKKEKTTDRDIVIEVKNYNIADYIHNVNFKLYKGEILGFAGVLGSGIHHLLRSLYGAAQKTEGEVFFEGKPVDIKNASEAIKLGIGYVTEDRKGEGLLNDMSVLQNISIIIIKFLTFFKGIFIRQKKELDVFNKIAKELDIKYANINQRIIYLSGGNQQKVVMGRTLVSNCKVLILLEPTRGIDVGAKAEIHKIMVELANRGISIIMTSSELLELVNLTDRCLVLYKGKLVAEFNRENMNEEKLVAAEIGKLSYANN